MTIQNGLRYFSASLAADQKSFVSKLIIISYSFHNLTVYVFLSLSILITILTCKNSVLIPFLQKDKTILIAGCRGQIGKALTNTLIKEVGADQVIATDLVEQDDTI